MKETVLAASTVSEADLSPRVLEALGELADAAREGLMAPQDQLERLS